MAVQEYWPVLLASGILVLYILVRFAFGCLSWLLYKKFGAKLKIGRINFFSLQEICVSFKNGTTLEIEKLWFSSYWFHSNLKSLIVLCVNDIRLQGDTEWIKSRTRHKPSEALQSKPFSFPSKLTSVLKLVSLHVLNASIMQLGTPEEEFLLHTSFQELNVFCGTYSCLLKLNVSVASSTVKVFKHLPLVQDEQTISESCLGHLSANIDIFIQVSSSPKLLLRTLSLSIKQPELILYEGLSISKLKRHVSSGLQSKAPQDEKLIDSTAKYFSEPMNFSNSIEKLHGLLQKCPQELSLKVDSFSIKLMKEGGHRAFTMDVELVEAQFKRGDITDDSHLPPILSSFCIKKVLAASCHVQFAQLLKVAAQLKIDNKEVDAKVQLSSFHLSYEREVLQYWLEILPFSAKTEKTAIQKKNMASKTHLYILEIFEGYHLQSTTEIDDVCVSARLPSCTPFTVGLTHCQCTLENYIFSIGTGDIFQRWFESTDLSLELLLETAYFKIGEKNLADIVTLKRYHIWNVPLSVGMVLLKVRLHPSDNSAKCMMDSFQIEWSPNLASLMLDIAMFMKGSALPPSEIAHGDMSGMPKDVSANKVNVSKKSLLLTNFAFQLNITAVNVFGVSATKTGIAARMDSFIINSRGGKMKASLEGCKLMPLNPGVKSYLCVKSADIKSSVIYLACASLTYITKLKEASLEFSDNIYLMWNTTFHMTALSILEEFTTSKSALLNRKNIVENAVTKEKLSSPISILAKLQGRISIGFTLSHSHRVIFSSAEITASFSEYQKSAQTGQLVVIFDNYPIFTFKQLVVTLTPGTEQHVLTRQSFDGLEQSNNRLLNIHMEELTMVFPYKYNFAESFNEEFVSVQKWLKAVHGKGKKLFTLESPLPPDLSIKTKLWTIELEDDPFEVKLRDNFELLEDEYHESLKRKRMLDEKIDSLRRTRLLLPGEKINELYSKLSKKNAEIYILRSRQLYQRGPMRTCLMTWQLDDIEVLAMADTSYHGTERVVHHMTMIDVESPFPEEGLEFNTLWARKVRCSTSSWTCNLRDFPQPLLQIKELHIWGFLIGAEQEASQRAKRLSTVEIGAPWTNATVERNMPSLKFYHDLTFDMEEWCMSYGPCWEPLMAQFGLSMEYVSRPSLDPSPALPWWDKMRLLYHGRLTYSIQRLTLLMRASLDPYNTTEQMELTWSDVIIEWTTGKILTKGDLDMYVHTASKYDDCRVLHIPNLKLSISVHWLCLGNPYDHHNVIPCAPDKIPEYSINQEHDSYRAFRSQNLNISYSFETRNIDMENIPTMLLYSSTLRWIENLKMILSGVTRLTRRGKLFSNTKPRKPQLSRHYRNVRVSLNLHKFQIFYWMSFAKRRGLELVGGRLSLSSEQTQSLVPVNDNLKHRPRPAWNIGYLNCELCDSEVWLNDCKLLDANESTAESFHAPVERSYFLSVSRVSYGREEIVKDVVSEEDKPDTPTHRLVVHGLKGAWTKHNRNVIFSLTDSYTKTVILKRNLATEALKGFKVETQSTPQKLRSQTSSSQTLAGAAPSPVSHLQSGHAVSMLQKLIGEAEANPMVFIEEMEGSTREQQLHGVAACQTDDVLQKKWLIELVNSQVMLRGCETSGYVIVSAAKAQILQRVHRPVWKDRSLVSKTTWVGSFECMQYYATVDAGEPGPSVDNVMWLSVDNIEERDSMVISDLPDLVGSGHSVGGVVSNTVGAAPDPESAPIQLQRIVSRCGCQFFYASFGENVDTSSVEEVPPLPEDIDLWEQEVAVDSFTLTHHDLDICTNSLQYAMILDLVNNLLLYVEPRRKEAIEKLQYMRFQLQLSSVDDQKEPILQLQERVRSLVAKLRRLEKEAYVAHRDENPDKENYLQELEQLENKIYECKEKLNTMNEELTLMISCFKETQILACKSRQRAASQEKGVTVARRAEVCFKHAQWRLTDADGQLGIADLLLSNFLYSKVTKSDDSVEHLLELGYITVTNLLPNQLYKHVLEPTDVQTRIPLDRQRLLRIYCRERAPVGGISIKEHLELNVIPITIGLTDAFYKAMLKFFFPGRDTEKEDLRDEEQEAASHNKKRTAQRGSSTFYGDRDDIEKMKERADKNHTFFYIKIPEVPLRVSYKGKKEKNIEDVHNLNLVLSTLEYHNKTWTWLDLLMGLKNDAKRILLSQAITQKLFRPRGNSPEKDNQPQEDEKAWILLGPKHPGAPERSSKRHFFGRNKKDHN